MEYKDIPTKADIESIAAFREPGCVSIYLPTGTLPSEADRARIELKNHLARAAAKLEEEGIPRNRIATIQREGEIILEDRDFWRYQSRSLVVFLDGEVAELFRLPNRLSSSCDVADRFHIKPLLRSVTFPQTALILALAGNSVRLIHVTPDEPAAEIQVEGLPKGIAAAVGETGGVGRGDEERLNGKGELQKSRMLEYVQAIDRALRPLLANTTEPLIVAGAEPLNGIFRGATKYPHVVDESLTGNPEEKRDEELAAAARLILDKLYAAKVDDLKEAFGARVAAGSATTDLSDIARSATFGAVEALIVDIDQRVPGTIDEESGAITFDTEDDGSNYGVVDEIIRRSLASKARIYALRTEDVPGGGPAAASMRFAV
ncbi:hypothetical protein [Leifsonia sp. NPDC058248]|uniref:baeRF11 domain-containing protein n=1 Tax=Leifsonia sp. NPDC058248 TaxID=3346402 RepID=UPI0036DE43F0